MPRLIDADAFFEEFAEIRDYEYASQEYEVDAVEVIRCRDCEWYKTNYTWNGKERKVCGIEPFEPIRREEDYCSFGERKE